MYAFGGVLPLTRRERVCYNRPTKGGGCVWLPVKVFCTMFWTISRTGGRSAAGKMFGEYMIYLNDKPVLLICDNTVFAKKLPELEDLCAGCPEGLPYEGTQGPLVLDPEDRERFRRRWTFWSKSRPCQKRKNRRNRSMPAWLKDAIFYEIYPPILSGHQCRRHRRHSRHHSPSGLHPGVGLQRPVAEPPASPRPSWTQATTWVDYYTVAPGTAPTRT